jgi:predicted ATPase
MHLSQDERSLLRAASGSEQAADHEQLTNWILLTGAPGSGKSTVAQFFARAGCKTVGDPGRIEVEQQLENGVPVQHSRSDYVAFQDKVLLRAERAFSGLDKTERVFFDYGVAEALAFLKVAGYGWEDRFVTAAEKYRFCCIFYFELLPTAWLSPDVVRVESQNKREQIGGLVYEIYEALGYAPIRVPPMSPEGRYRFVQAALEKAQRVD